MSEKQINKENIDILHCSSRSIEFVSSNKRFYGKLNYDCPTIMTKIYYTMCDEIYKLHIHTGTINYNHDYAQEQIKMLIVENHNISNLIKLEEILQEDVSIDTPMFNEKILPHIRNQKINIINGD